VIVILGSADRDPERFEEPDTLDSPRRESRHGLAAAATSASARRPRGSRPRRARDALRRLPGLRLGISPEELRWRPVPLFRSLVELPVAWDV
jgi:cytochrome P450